MLAGLPDPKDCVFAKSHNLVVTDIGLRKLPGTRMADDPMLDLLFIGGGLDVKTLMEHEKRPASTSVPALIAALRKGMSAGRQARIAIAKPVAGRDGWL